MAILPNQYHIYVRQNSTLTLVGELDQYDKLTYTRRYNQVGVWVLQLDASHPMAAYLADPGYGILINRITTSGTTTDFSGPVRYFERQGGTRKKLIVKGYDDLYWLLAREAYPVTSYLYQTVALAEGTCIGLYTFGETSGTTAVNQFAPGIDNGTYHGSFTLNQASLTDDPTRSTLLNGTTGYVSIPNSASLFPTGNAPYSLKCWFTYTGAPAATEILAHLGTTHTNNSAYMGILNTGHATFQMLGVNHGALGSALSVGIHQMCLTYDGTTARLYVDAVQVVSGTPGTCTLAATAAAFGASGGGVDAFFGGGIQWGGIYLAPLAVTDIAYDYQVGLLRFNAQQYDTEFGAAETVVKSYVSNNAASTAFVERQIPNMTVEADAAQGAFVAYSARFDQLLTKDGNGLLQILGNTGGIGMRVVQTTAPALEFQCYVPADKTSNAIFSEGLGNLGDYDYSVDAQDVQNYVIAGGGGTGTSRAFVTGQDSASIASYGRVEGFINAGSTTNTQQLSTQITNALDNGASQTAFQATLIETDGLQYGRDFGLGDKVTVFVDNTTLTDIVREVQIDLDPSAGETITPVIGTPGAGQITAALRHYERLVQAAFTRLTVLERAP